MELVIVAIIALVSFPERTNVILLSIIQENGGVVINLIEEYQSTRRMK